MEVDNEDIGKGTKRSHDEMSKDERIASTSSTITDSSEQKTDSKVDSFLSVVFRSLRRKITLRYLWFKEMIII